MVADLCGQSSLSVGCCCCGSCFDVHFLLIWFAAGLCGHSFFNWAAAADILLLLSCFIVVW